MPTSNLLRAALVSSVVFAGFASLFGGCSMSENRYPMPLAASQAQYAWGPIQQCAAKENLKAEPGVNRVTVHLGNLLDAVYLVRDDHVDMDIVIWAETTESDRKTIVDKAHARGVAIWHCAEAIGFTPAPPAPASTDTVAPAASASVSATTSASTTP